MTLRLQKGEGHDPEETDLSSTGGNKIDLKLDVAYGGGALILKER